MSNSFGHQFRVHSFGESHGGGLGVVIDGCPAGVVWNQPLLDQFLKRRRPGLSEQGSHQVVSARQETDAVEVLSGVFEGRTLGTPIAMLVRNQDAQSKDYDQIQKSPRPGHVDDLWKIKFGHADHRGGGRASGRETVARVMAGAVAQMLVQQLSPDCRVFGFASVLGPFSLSREEFEHASEVAIDECVARFPSTAQAANLLAGLRKIQSEGESWGGEAEIQIFNPPQGLGQPVFRKLKSDLAQALMSVGAVHAFELGPRVWEESSVAAGSVFHRSEKNYGGIRGGISTGEKIECRVKMKPTSSIGDVAKKGRHDPCLIPRAIPVFEAMTWLVLADHMLLARLDRV